MLERPNLFALTGPTCARKTTILKEVKSLMRDQVSVFTFDAYDLFPDPPSDRVIINWEDPELFDMNQYHADLFRLFHGMPILLQDNSRDARGTISEVYPTNVTFVEGVFAYHSVVARQLFKRRFYLHIDEDEMVRRRLRRSAEDSQKAPWHDPDYICGPMIEGTRSFVLPQRDHAHIVLDGMLPPPQIARQIVWEIAVAQGKVLA